MGRQDAAIVVHEADLSTFDLAALRLAAKLADRFDDVEHPARRA